MAERAGQARAWLALTALALCMAGLVVAVHRESPRTLISAHGLLHTAIAQQFDAATEIPPENPFLAGEPLAYYWFFHGLAAGVGRLLGTDALHALEALVVVAAMSLVFLAGGLARSLWRCTGAGVLLAFLVFAGAQVQAPLVLGLRWLQRGPEILADDGTYLWGIAHPVSQYMRLWDPFSLYGPLLNFFFNITSRPAAIAALVGVVWALWALLSRGGLPRAVALTLSVALCSALSSLIGIASAGALGGLLALQWLARRGSPQPLPLARLAAAETALGAGLVLGGLTFWHLVSVGGAESQILGRGAGVVLDRSLAIAASSWPLWLLSVVTWRRSQGRVREFCTLLLAAAGLLCLAAVVVSLPVSNQVNFFHAALPLLCIVAAGSVVDADGGLQRGRALWIGLAFVPVLALQTWVYTGRAPASIAFAGRELVRTPATSDRARLYAWVRASTPADAVLVTDPYAPPTPVAGNVSEVPAFTRRELLTERPGHYAVGYSPVAVRRADWARTLLAGDALDPVDARALAALGRPVWIVRRRGPESAEAEAALERRYGPPAFDSDTLRVYRWTP